MQTLKALNELKQQMNEERNALYKKRKALHDRLKSGEDFFKMSKRHSQADLAKGAETFAKLTRQVMQIDKEIFDLDVIIGTKLELLLNDCEIKVTAASRKNDMGEQIHKQDFVLSLYPEEDKVVITPNDLWMLKILKPALKYCNIEVKEPQSEKEADIMG